MASHQAKTVKSRTKDTGSNNGWTGYYAESDSAVEKAGRGGKTHPQSTPVARVGQERRRRPRGAEFFPNQFWRFVAKGARNQCWLWQGTVLARNGYGTFWHAEQKRMILAHRLAWMLTKGAIPDGLKTLHKCDVPACCNPHHLWLGTQLDNMRDCIAKGRRSPDAHTKRGAIFTPEHRAALSAAAKRRHAKKKRQAA
jgi:hypothetical protein